MIRHDYTINYIWSSICRISYYGDKGVNNMWIILTILLAITCMWLIKVNKGLIDRNELLLAEMLVEKIEEHEKNNNKGE